MNIQEKSMRAIIFILLNIITIMFFWGCLSSCSKDKTINPCQQVTQWNDIYYPDGEHKETTLCWQETACEDRLPMWRAVPHIQQECSDETYIAYLRTEIGNPNKNNYQHFK